MDAIRWQGNSLALLDQTRLPVEERVLPFPLHGSFPTKHLWKR